MQNAAQDREGNDYRLIPGIWRNGAVMQEMDEVRAPTGETQRGKRQRIFLKNYVYSPQRAVPWQKEMIKRKREKEEGGERRREKTPTTYTD